MSVLFGRHTIPGPVPWNKCGKRMGAWGFALTSGNWITRLSKMYTHYLKLMRPSTACRDPSGSPHLTWKLGIGQVEMDKDSKPLITFMVGPLGFNKCERMPFGLTNTPATFQWLMETCHGDLYLNWCIIYLDDIVIFSKDPASDLERLEVILKKLEHAGLKLKPLKCEIFY